MPRQRHLKRPEISRRQMLRRLAFTGAAGGLIGAGGVAAALLSTRPQVVVLPHGGAAAGLETTVARPHIVSRADWGALPVNHAARNEYGDYVKGSNPEGWYVYANDLRESYQTLVIHHSAFYELDGLETLLEIQRLHREDRGWADIGYHFLLDKQGTIYEGRDLHARGAHTAGYNTGSAGICLMGDFRFVAPSRAQLYAAQALIRWLVYRLHPTHLAGHQDFNQTTACPGAFLIDQLEALAAAVGLELGIDGFRPVARRDDPCDCCGCDAHL